MGTGIADKCIPAFYFFPHNLFSAKVAFKLSRGTKDVEDESAATGCRINRLSRHGHTQSSSHHGTVQKPIKASVAQALFLDMGFRISLVLVLKSVAFATIFSYINCKRLK
jgi:hypothetical protein